MCGFLLRIIINGILLFLIITKLPGIFVDTLGGMLLGIAIIGIANGTLRPILLRTARPFNWINLGGITLVMNVITSLLVIKMLPGFQIYSMIAPISGIFIITICSCTLSKIIQDR